MFIQEEHFKNIFNTVRESILILDADMRVLSANRSFFTTFKVDSANTIGSLLYDLGNGQWNIPYLRMLIEDVLPKNDTVDDYEIVHNFESIGQKTMLLNACKIREKKNDVPIILLAIEDITERKRLEDQLTESEERYRRIFETASDGIVLLEKREGHIIHMNPAAEKMLGYPDGESVGKKLQDIGVSLEMNDFPAIMHSLQKSDILNYDDVLVKTKSGQDLCTDIYLVDRTKLAQCNIRDVTERKKLEAQLHHSQKMEAVGTLAGGIAHDFNNILHAIMGYGTMVMEKLEVGSPSKENMNELLIAADRAAMLTKKLLIFTRKQLLEMKSININELILGVQKMLVRIIRENITFTLKLADKPLIVVADAGQIEQVLINLAANARDAMQEGGQLTISTELEKIDSDYVAAYGYGKPGDYALITVTDTGQGMNAETQKKIFEPYFTTKEIGEGTGLGLAISYSIVKQHYGYIKVYSEPRQGTVFKIFLPLSEKTASSGLKLATAAPPRGGTETILVAEDDASLRMLSKTVLESFGYTVITAKDGEGAITKFMENKEQISLVLLDMIMPKKNGKEVSEAIGKVSPGVRTLFVSGYAMDTVKSTELTGPRAGFIQKPAPPRDLLIKVRELLDR